MRYFFARLDEKRKLLGNFEKIFDEKSIEKLNFYFYFGKFVSKNRAIGNNTFLQQFFRFRGGGDFPLSPLATPLVAARQLLSRVLCKLRQ